MRTTWALAITCDGCGRIAEGRTSPDQAAAWKQPAPEGWYGPDPMSWRLVDPFGWNVSDLCSDCLALPFNDLIERITQRSKELAGGHSG